MNGNICKAGDRLLIYKDFIIQHSATYMGNGQVAHTHPRKGLCVETVEEFAQGQTVRHIDNGGIAPSLLWERYQELAKNPKYRLFNQNCEQVSSYLETGVMKSPQLQGAVGGALSGLMLAKYARINNGYALLAFAALGAVAGAKMATSAT